jgi:flagellar hook protein FlgE
MSSSLIASVSGLQASEQMLNVVGNNLANLNTTGFKAQTPVFADLLYQTLSAGSSISTGGGTNPLQIGYGTLTSGIETNFTSGALTTTGNPLDLALTGQGLFVANSPSGPLYTRDGAFSIDAQGFLVDPATGYLIQRTGTVGEATATAPGFQTVGSNNIQIPVGGGVPAQATANVTLQGNLSANAASPAAQTLTSTTPFQSGGGPATSGTTLNSLSDNQKPYQTGDTIDLQGTTAAGVTVNATLAAGPTTTLSDLVNAINANFPGSTASLTSSGNLVVQANNTGPSQLQVIISDASTNKGASSWGLHGLQVTTPGQNGATVTGSIQIFDAQGTAHNLSLTFQKQAANNWNLTASIPASDGTMINSTIQGITFNNNGSFQQASGTGTISFTINGLATPQTIAFSFGSANGFNGLTQFGSASSASATNQNGFAAGTLSSVSIGQDGTINGSFTNGQVFALAQLAVANFTNPAGLIRQGQNYFAAGFNSGLPQIGTAQTGGLGGIQSGSLETSNVDVAASFTQLITAQQSFEGNSRALGVNNQVLQDLANLIH